MATTLATPAHMPRFLLPRLISSSPLNKSAVLTSSAAHPWHSSNPQYRPQPRHFTTQADRQCSLHPTVRHGSRPSPRTLLASQQPNSPQASIPFPLASRRPFSATAHLSRDHHFDTLKFVQRLQDEGFSEEQAKAMMKVLSDVIEESIQNLTRTMVLRENAEKATYEQKVDFAKLRSELLTADSTESSLTRASHERLTNELAKLNNRLRDEIQRTQASVRLDLNLEKGRIREEANAQELKIKETETRIEQETAVLREKLEAVKFSTLQWLMGVCTGTAALILGAWRLLM
ncbi:Protein fmp32, mitochondrial [Coniosporium apollinis]|uniref:Protein fmp32, mitochondrial n=2 Tax=Coniosporium TaxID=2810619 RepID=A0ABQ9P2G5_9PEZI|nr:Protein fmp32, mitochondrial [Cladosporium sp. JES 115]KAJ9668799.1 Protein fmp32, mitochondrial [Coniosporium apollinis]